MDSITSLYYPNLARQGYRFQANCFENEVEKKTKRYRDNGLEVVVEERAYDMNSETIPGMKAILIREK